MASEEVFGSVPVGTVVAPVKTVEPLVVFPEVTPDGFVKFEFNPDSKDGAGRPQERVQVLLGSAREFLKKDQPFYIESWDWRTLRNHAPGVFREVSSEK